MFVSSNTIIDNRYLVKTYTNYKGISTFIKKYNNVNYAEFYYYLTNELSIFIVEPDIDFETLEIFVDKINKALPAINNIFSKPLLHLKEENVIMPVEAVRHIDNNTLQHIGMHSELWDNIQNDSIKPSKLLTRVYNDDYSIYENLVFCDVVDKILEFSRYNIRLLNDLILTKQNIDLNLLERVHHIQYFLALGKLYTGYIRFYDKYYDVSQKYLKKINKINNNVSSRLNSLVYKKNLKRSKNLKLRKTNILSMHKDYQKIYSLLNFFEKKDIRKDVEMSNKNYLEFKKDYFNYCQIMIIFALNHFNFIFSGEQSINVNKIDLSCSFKKWNIQIRNNKVGKYDIIEVNSVADEEYKIVFIPLVDNLENRSEYYHEVINIISPKVQAFEYIICTPYDYDRYYENEYLISISEIESFRRLQKLFLRSMVLTDKKRKDCPFCNNNLVRKPDSYSVKNKTYFCKSCMLIISDVICPEMKKPYSYTSVSNLIPKDIDDYLGDERLYNKKLESLMFFRNITNITKNLDIVCPHCKKIHKYF